MAHYVGTAGDITADGTALECREWTANTTVEAVDVTDKASGGKQEVLAGIERTEVNASGVFDDGISYVDPGDEVTIILAAGDGGGNVISGTYLVTGFEYNSPLDGAVEWSLTATSNG